MLVNKVNNLENELNELKKIQYNITINCQFNLIAFGQPP